MLETLWDTNVTNICQKFTANFSRNPTVLPDFKFGVRQQQTHATSRKLCQKPGLYRVDWILKHVHNSLQREHELRRWMSCFIHVISVSAKKRNLKGQYYHTYQVFHHDLVITKLHYIDFKKFPLPLGRGFQRVLLLKDPYKFLAGHFTFRPYIFFSSVYGCCVKIASVFSCDTCLYRSDHGIARPGLIVLSSLTTLSRSR